MGQTIAGQVFKKPGIKVLTFFFFFGYFLRRVEKCETLRVEDGEGGMKILREMLGDRRLFGEL